MRAEAAAGMGYPILIRSRALAARRCDVRPGDRQQASRVRPRKNQDRRTRQERPGSLTSDRYSAEDRSARSIRAPWREADMESSVADNSSERSQDHLRRIGYRIVARQL